MRFPSSFATEALALENVATSGWRLWPPLEWTRVSIELSGWDYGGPNGTFDANGYAGPEGVVIGGDGADIVCLLVRPGSCDLAETVFRWDHETATFTRLAARLAELPELLEVHGDSLLFDPSTCPRRARAARSSRVVSVVDAVCKFCGSEMKPGSRCGVCARNASDEPEEDASLEIASRLLRTLLEAKRIELGRPSEVSRLCSELATVIEASSSVDAAATAACALLVDDSAVSDLFADDDEVAHMLRSLGRDAFD